MTKEEIRQDERRKIQQYIDENGIYRVEFGHYEGIEWIPLKTHKVNLGEEK